MKKFLVKIQTYIMALVLTGGIGVMAYAQEEPECATGFKINESRLVIDDCLEELGRKASGLYKESRLEKFEICGYSSPDGPYAFNSRLAGDRAGAVRKYFNHTWGIPMESITVRKEAEDWAKTRELIAESDISGKDNVLAIIDGESDGDRRETKLRALNGGRTWRELATNVFPHVRRAEVHVVSDRNEYKATLTDEGTVMETVAVPVETERAVEDTPLMTTVAEDTVVAMTVPEWQRHAYVKTNVPAWFLLWINLAGEIDIAPHWSANLSLYYSGFNYFQSTRKYRTFTIMPEVRYWFRGDNQGFFVAPHFGLGWYNVAFEGAYRYQDHDGNTPAIGGGINAGYRFNISRNGRWRLECSVGFGIYRLDYDLFQNRHNGLLVGRKQRTFYGIDNAALSICYMFDVKKKGGKK